MPGISRRILVNPGKAVARFFPNRNHNVQNLGGILGVFQHVHDNHAAVCDLVVIVILARLVFQIMQVLLEAGLFIVIG